MDFYQYNSSRIVPISLKGRIEDSYENNIETIENLSKINIIAGPNNSGKSYIIRELFKEPLEPIYLSHEFIIETNKTIKEYTDKFFDLISSIVSKEIMDQHPRAFITGIRDYGEAISPEMHEIQDWTKIKDFYDIKKFAEGLLKLKTAISTENKDSLGFRDFSPNLLGQIQLGLVINELIEIVDTLTDFSSIWLKKYDYKHKYEYVYIHHLRSIGRYSINASDFIKSISEAFAFHGRGRYTKPKEPENKKTNFEGWIVETGLDLYSSIEEMYYRVSSRKQLTEFEQFLSEQFFGNKDVAIVPARNVPVQLDNMVDRLPTNPIDKVFEFEIQIGNEEPLAIHNLGTGIQMMIILTWFMFQCESGVIFIEEPELFIHPGMQKQLMNIYDTHPRSKQFQFFIATHSNHILDYVRYSKKVRIFSINKGVRPQTASEKTKFQLTQHNKQEIKILDSLGIMNSSVFLTNCTIWVEGITDWKYLQKLFELYQLAQPTEYLENLHYGYLEYGGSLIAHWMFDDEISDEDDQKFQEQIRAKNISNRILVIADRDENKEEKHKRLKDVLNEDYFVLPCREIENILPLDIIFEVMCTIEGVKQLNDNLKKYAVNNKNKLQYSKLSKSLPKIISSICKQKSKYTSYLEDSGRSGKLSFCNLAIGCLNLKYNLLKQQLNNKQDSKITNDDIQNLIGINAWNACEAIYNFIKRNNLVLK